MLAIAQMQAGNRLGDIGHAVQAHAEGNGYGVVRQLVGHGIGTKMHEEPQVPNYGKPRPRDADSAPGSGLGDRADDHRGDLQR